MFVKSRLWSLSPAANNVKSGLARRIYILHANSSMGESNGLFQSRIYISLNLRRCIWNLAERKMSHHVSVELLLKDTCALACLVCLLVGSHHILSLFWRHTHKLLSAVRLQPFSLPNLVFGSVFFLFRMMSLVSRFSYKCSWFPWNLFILVSWSILHFSNLKKNWRLINRQITLCVRLQREYCKHMCFFHMTSLWII